MRDIICPMKHNANPQVIDSTAYSCDRDECAWWADNECVIQTIAHILCDIGIDIRNGK